MKIKLNNIGKRFNREWIFRKVDFQLESNKVYGVIGPNGSGKSSLLKLISQAEIPSEGKIEFSLNEKEIRSESAYNYLSIAAPYTDVAEQLTLGEFLNFHLNFSLMQFHKYSLTEIENMIPWEREVYVKMLLNHIEEEKEKQNNA